MRGLGLIKASTVFEQNKIRTRVNGEFQKVEGIFKGLSGKKFEGYEIHMGQTSFNNVECSIQFGKVQNTDIEQKPLPEDMYSSKTISVETVKTKNMKNIDHSISGKTMNTDSMEKVGSIKNIEQSSSNKETDMSQTYQYQRNSLTILTETNGNVKEDGVFCGNIYGSYVHGIFDSEEVLFEIADALMSQKGLKYDRNSTFDIKAYKEQQYDLLADALRTSLDMKYIYEVIEKGID
jgi:cobyric acid synthase